MICLKLACFFVILVSSVAWKWHQSLPLKEFGRKVLYPAILATTLVQPALASREVGNIATSGIIFKDSLRINAFDDPKVSGVVLYLSDFDRPITDKLANNFFNDPSSSALTCVRSGPMKFKQDIYMGKDGEEVFEESRSLFFKVRDEHHLY